MAYLDLLPTGDNMPQTIKASKVARMLGVTNSTVYAWSREGRLPQVIELGPRTHVFRLDELREAFARLDVGADLTVVEDAR